MTSFNNVITSGMPPEAAVSFSSRMFFLHQVRLGQCSCSTTGFISLDEGANGSVNKAIVEFKIDVRFILIGIASLFH